MGSRTREQQLAAGMFIKYMTEVDQQVALAIATGYAPSRKSVAQNATMTRFWEENPAYRTVYDQLPNVRSQDWARAFVPNGDSYLQTPLAQILLQNTAAGTAYPPAAAQIRSSFDQNVKPYL
jgi:sn-glycerol 3-phosphate transport system substrate-binding protein